MKQKKAEMKQDQQDMKQIQLKMLERSYSLHKQTLKNVVTWHWTKLRNNLEE